jgi:hypothetical protein
MPSWLAALLAPLTARGWRGLAGQSSTQLFGSLTQVTVYKDLHMFKQSSAIYEASFNMSVPLTARGWRGLAGQRQLDTGDLPCSHS